MKTGYLVGKIAVFRNSFLKYSQCFSRDLVKFTQAEGLQARACALWTSSSLCAIYHVSPSLNVLFFSSLFMTALRFAGQICDATILVYLTVAAAVYLFCVLQFWRISDTAVVNFALVYRAPEAERVNLTCIDFRHDDRTFSWLRDCRASTQLAVEAPETAQARTTRLESLVCFLSMDLFSRASTSSKSGAL